MSKLKNTKNEISSKIEAIKKINDDPKKGIEKVYDKYVNDLVANDPFGGKKLGGLINKGAKKKNNNQDIFGELIKICEQFLSKNKSVETSNRLYSKTRIKNHALDSASVTVREFRKIIINNVRKGFFAGDGICGGNTTITTDSINLSPQEFDLVNVFTIDPTSTVGKIVYEPQQVLENKQKVNRSLYSTFASGTYSFETLNQKTLFDATWNSGTQLFNFSGLTQGVGTINVSDFFQDYYTSIEMPKSSDVIKNAMLSTVQGDGSETLEFTKAQNEINRILKKLLTICGSPVQKDNLENQNATDQFEEDDEDIGRYFDFDDVEGIDIDDEDARYRKVLRFTDCNNFEIPVNTNIIEDFVYFSDKKPLSENIDEAFSKAAADAFEQSNGGITLPNFQASLFSTFILNLPKALISTALSPKIFLPMAIVYKIVNNLTGTFLSIKNLFKILKKIVYGIIRDIFWRFISEFWKRVKKDLLDFLGTIIIRILKNKYARYVQIIKGLIALLTRLLNANFNNCLDLFNTILSLIRNAISARGGFNIPGFLLGFADEAAGYSQDRAFLNLTERLSAAGIPTGPINGQPNDLLTAFKSMIDANTEEMDQNGFVKAANKEVRIPSPVGPIIIPPGIINVAGKTF